MTSRAVAAARNPYALVGMTTVATGAATAAVYKAAALIGSPEQFFAYATARRISAFLVPVFALGFGVSVPLLLARGADPQEGRRLARFQGVAAVVLTGAAATVLLTIGGTSALERVAGVLGQLDLIAVLLLSATLSSAGVAYAYFRGLEDYYSGSLLLILTSVVFPLIAILTLGWGLTWVLCCWALLNGIVLMVIAVRSSPGPSASWSPLQLVTFTGRSLLRVPGDVALAAMFALPVVQVVTITDARSASVFAYFFSLIGLVVTASTPLSVVILPRVAARVEQGGIVSVLRTQAIMTITGLAVGGVVAVVVALFPGFIVRVLMAAQYVPQAEVLASLAPAALGLALFAFVRSVLDGATRHPLTSYLCVSALIGYLAFVWLDPDTSIETLAIAVNSSFLWLGMMTAVMGFWVVARRVST